MRGRGCPIDCREGEGVPNRLQGWYHLCCALTADCPETSKYKQMIHSDRYRNLGKGVPSAKKVPWLADKIVKSAFWTSTTSFVMKEAMRTVTKGHHLHRQRLPWLPGQVMKMRGLELPLVQLLAPLLTRE